MELVSNSIRVILTFGSKFSFHDMPTKLIDCMRKMSSFMSLAVLPCIVVTHLIIIIKSELSVFPIVIIFFAVVCLRWMYHHLLSVSCISRNNWVLFLLLLCSLMMCVINRVHLWPQMPRWSYSFVCTLHYPIFTIMQTYLTWLYWRFKMLVRYILSNVCLRLSHFSQSSFMQYMRLWVFSLPIPLHLMIVRIHVLNFTIIIKSDVWPICHCLGLVRETIICFACLSIFLSFVLVKLYLASSGLPR